MTPATYLSKSIHGRRETDGWWVVGASRTGARHRALGRGNQDAIGWTTAGLCTVAAVADGHGARPHYRSDRGAALAVAAALDHLRNARAISSPGEHVLAGWRRRVLADMARDPVVGDALPGAALAPYGSTLIALAADAKEVFAVQIGDGDLLLLDAADRITRPLGTDLGLVGEQTYSLCQDEAASRFRVARTPACGTQGPIAAILASDGVAKSLGTDGFEAAVRHLVEHGRSAFDDLVGVLPEWLDGVSREGNGDDVSLCLLLRSACVR